jgi:HSP20 family protein
MAETEQQGWLMADDETMNKPSQKEHGWELHHHPHRWRPATDVYEDDNAYTIMVEIAGMRGSEISVTFDNQTLTILGQRAKGAGIQAYHQMEISYGEFESQIKLPGSINTSKIEAVYTDGFLRVTLPKRKPRKISIDS